MKAQMKNDQPSVPNAQVPKELREHWPEKGGKPAVFLAAFEVPAKHPSNTTKEAWKAALFSGIGSAAESGWTIEYILVEMDGDTPREHRLNQGGKSVAFQSKQEGEREAGEPPDMKQIDQMTPEILEMLDFGGDVMEVMRQLTG